jgi:hypothetical protein
MGHMLRGVIRALLVAGAAGMLAISCAGGRSVAAPAPVPPEGAAGSARSILFIGNSLTSANDLPRRVAAVAAAGGVSIVTDGVAIDGASLSDHWEDGRARRAIASRAWSVVVLQQGPSTLPESRTELIRATTEIGDAIRRAGATPALLMVWPLPGQRAADVSASYRAAAEATGSVLIPAGDAWVRAKSADPSLVLTGADGYHPSPLGTEVAALSVVCTLFASTRPQPQLALSPAQRVVLATAACPEPRQ